MLKRFVFVFGLLLAKYKWFTSIHICYVVVFQPPRNSTSLTCLTPVSICIPSVLKTRIQLNPKLYPNFGSALKTIVKNEGVRALSLGLTPTFVGYSAQGFCKYGLYEFFKTKLSQTLGQEFSEKHATGIYLAAGTTAEVFADLALTPFEAVRIRMVAQPTWASSMMGG